MTFLERLVTFALVTAFGLSVFGGVRSAAIPTRLHESDFAGEALSFLRRSLVDLGRREAAAVAATEGRDAEKSIQKRQLYNSYGTGAYNPYNQYGAGAYNPYNQYGAGAYNQYGTGAYNPYSQYGAGGYNPYNQYGTGTYNRYNQYGTGTYSPYNQYGTGAYNPYSQYGTGAYNPYNRYGNGAYNPYGYNPYATTGLGSVVGTGSTVGNLLGVG